MKRIKLFTAALLLAAISAGNDVWALSDSGKKDTRPIESPKFFSGNAIRSRSWSEKRLWKKQQLHRKPQKKQK